jgi:hypothetical protein
MATLSYQDLCHDMATLSYRSFVISRLPFVISNLYYVISRLPFVISSFYFVISNGVRNL